MSRGDPSIRVASAADALAFGRLLHAFNAEFGEPEPAASVIAERAAPLIESGERTILFVGEGPDGFAQLRFRPSLYTGATALLHKCSILCSPWRQRRAGT